GRTRKTPYERAERNTARTDPGERHAGARKGREGTRHDWKDAGEERRPRSASHHYRREFRILRRGQPRPRRGVAPTGTFVPKL
ncbi:hypothetical protein NDU88_005451, partial [Pleurodeles waltl]